MKRIVLLFFAAVLLGGGLAYYFFYRGFNDEIPEGYSTAQAFQIGAFTNYDNALRVANRNNGIVVTDADIYRVYVAVLEDDNAIRKMSQYYDQMGLNYYLKDVLVSNSFVKEIADFEKKINAGSDDYKILTENVLIKYQNSL